MAAMPRAWLRRAPHASQYTAFACGDSVVLRATSFCARRTPAQGRLRTAGPADHSRNICAPGITPLAPVEKDVYWLAHAASEGAVPQQKTGGFDTSLLFSVLLVLTLGVLNRVLQKMATVPLGNYLFFLAQVQTFGYVLFYGAILAQRRRTGAVTDEMLAAPDKKKFVAIGFLEASAQLISMFCVSKLPGVVLPLLQQTILLWQVALGYLFQGQKFERVQILGIFLVAAGVAKAAWPTGGGSVLGQTDPAYAALFCFAFLILALVAVIKDSVFTDAKAKLGGRSLDLFVVNTNGSLVQAFFVLLLLPLLSSLKGIPFKQLPAYFSAGFGALLGAAPSSTGASSSTGAPLVPLAYIAVNLTMNVAVLNLLRTAGPVVTTLSLSVLVPLTIWAFTWPWPLIGAPATLSTGFLVGTAVLLAGLLAYNLPSLSGSRAAA